MIIPEKEKETIKFQVPFFHLEVVRGAARNNWVVANLISGVPRLHGVVGGCIIRIIS